VLGRKQQKNKSSGAPVAHIYNTGYSGGRDQPVQIMRPYLEKKNPSKKKKG
jgi:hypothetical protein